MRFWPRREFDLSSTRDLLERLDVDEKMRRLCGWSSARAVPSEATFSRAFAEFTESSLPSRLHEALVGRTLGEHLVEHISRNSTAIEAREKPAQKAAKAPKPKRKRGRPRKGEERPKEPERAGTAAGHGALRDAGPVAQGLRRGQEEETQKDTVASGSGTNCIWMSPTEASR